MPADSITEICPAALRSATNDEEGGPLTIYTLPLGPQETVIAMIEAGRGREVVRFISIGFRGLRTAEGVGVGSTFHELKTTYPHVSAGDNEGVVWVWPDPDIGVSFALDVTRDELNPQWRVKPSVIPDTARVTELLVRRVTR
jgi:hypothetical protein